MRPGRIIEIKTYGTTLKKNRGFLLIVNKDEEDHVPISDLASIIVHPGVLISSNLIASLADVAVEIIFCDTKRSPVARIDSKVSSYEKKTRLLQQVNTSKPLSKKIWAEIVKRKIKNQYLHLISIDDRFKNCKLKELSTKVLSGDTQNLEADAARRYWPLLFGSEFRRDRSLPGSNAQLNFGYTILRHTFLRYIVSAGLSPYFGVFHRNPRNLGALADDLMEPYRPFVDSIVIELFNWQDFSLSVDVKNHIASFLEAKIHYQNRKITIENLIFETTHSYVKAMEDNKSNVIVFPDFPERGITHRPDFEVSSGVAAGSF